MRTSLRPMNKVLAISLLTALTAATVGCSRSYDTTQVEASGGTRTEAAPTTSIIVETIPPSTAPRLEPLAATTTDLQDTLTQLVAGFAEDPDLVAAVRALNDGDLASIAAMFDIDLGALSSLGLSTGDIGALGETVLADLATGAGGAGLAALLGGLGGAGGSAPLDPMTLIGLLAQSLNIDIDVTRIAQSAIPQLIGALFSGLQGAQLIVTPEIVLQLDDMLERIDPHAFDDFIVTADNAPFIALLTSVVLANNPLLQQGITDNPDLSPQLRELLKELEKLNAELGETTSESLYEALLRGLFQDQSG